MTDWGGEECNTPYFVFANDRRECGNPAEGERNGLLSVVIPDLIRNLAFITPVTWVKLEILKQVQDDKMGQIEGRALHSVFANDRRECGNLAEGEKGMGFPMVSFRT